MKIIIAQSALGAELDGYATALCDVLGGAGHATQRLVLPSIAAPGRALTNAASLRLLGTEAADALICLDPVAALLRHRRKYAWLLDGSFLDPDQGQRAAERPSDRHYLANVLRSAVAEARAIFAPSRFALARLHAQSFGRATLLRPDLPGLPSRYPRSPGPEVLLLNPIDDAHRPDLLVACLAALPEPYRARWVAPLAQADSLARLRRLAADAGVEQRLAIDTRAIDACEKAYLLAHAAVLLELGQEAFALTDTVRQALRDGVPVIACRDGGALTEPGSKQAQPDGAALAKAVLAAGKPAATKARAGTATSDPRGWAPLLKAFVE